MTRSDHYLTFLFRILMCLILFGGLFGLSVTHADPLKVSAIQWVQTNPDIPHIAVNGQPTMLQAIVEGGSCGGTYQYRWDWNGDGDFDDELETSQSSSSSIYAGYFAPLSLDITFPISLGDRLYYPKVEVTCAGETGTAVMPVLIRVARVCTNYLQNSQSPGCGEDSNLALTRQIFADRAVDRGLWYLFKQGIHSSNDNHGHSDHICTLPGAYKLYSLGHALNAFLRRGHGHGEGRENDPYYRYMTQCGIHAMLSMMEFIVPDFDDTADLGEVGKGIQFYSNFGITSGHWSSYESTAWVEPIANFGSPEYVSPVGNDSTFNRSLREIGQDLADGMIHCMTPNGGWYYTCNSGNTTDGSTNGWAPEALRLLARKLNVETYDSMKTLQRNWLAAHCPNGYCSYHNGGAKLAGNTLVGYGWTESEQFDANPQAASSLSAAQSWFMTDSSHWGLYYIYAVTKGLRSFIPEVSTLPNGIQWSQTFTDYFLTGNDGYHSDSNARQNTNGSWTWFGVPFGASHVAEVTGLTIQVVQSWLEVWAYARAYPELIGPGAAVTFDHSWSYTLDPSVNIFDYKWNVIDYINPSLDVCAEEVSGCTDLNGDQDCDDPGEMCNEDRDGNGVVDGDEIVWEFVTIDPFERFSFVYQEDLDWGEAIKYNIRLRVTDTQGRYVDDFESVQVTISKENHPPTVVHHPGGINAYYVGYVDSTILIDGRASYDVDSFQEPYPGDNARPQGIPDSITSIHFDLNQDGDFDDEGEDGTLNPVRLTLNVSSAIGDQISIPIRVCDDGQWADTCFDGIDQEDCSLCSFGSAAIRLLENVEPPDIVTCGSISPCDPYVSQENGEGGLGETELDLSDSSDPEGGLELTYWYELIEGDGVILSDYDHLDTPENMGPRPRYIPAGEGTRIDIIRVTVTDSGGLSSVGFINILIPNIAPNAWWNPIEYDHVAPQINGSTVVSLGNGWYRVTVNAQPIYETDVYFFPMGSDVTDTFSTFIDVDSDNIVDYTLTENELVGGVGPVTFPSGYQGVAWAWAMDDDDEESERSSLDFYVPSKPSTLTYDFDLSSDGDIEVSNSGQNSFLFFYDDEGTGEVSLTISVTDGQGETTEVELGVPVGNQEPIFEQLATLRDDWTVTFVTSAFDADGDGLTYTFDPGDGTPIQTNRGGIFIYTYQEDEYGTYEAVITVSDGRGGEISHTFNITFEPEINLPPIIDNYTVNVRTGGHTDVMIEARDPEGQSLEIWIDWGDGTPRERVFGGRISRRLGYQPTPYIVSVEVTDIGGESVDAQTSASVIDLPTEITRIQQHRLADGARLFTATAIDPDSPQLEYYWDFNQDDVWEEEALIDNIITYTYPETGDHTVRLGVRDPWSGVITESTLFVPSERPPVISSVEVDYGVRGYVSLEIEAYDPEGSALTYEVMWGDDGQGQDLDLMGGEMAGGETAGGEMAGGEMPGGEMAGGEMAGGEMAGGETTGGEMTSDQSYRPLSNGQGAYRYPYSETAFNGRVRVTDASGLKSESPFIVQLSDHPTEIDEVSITQTINGEIFIRVTAIDLDSPNELTYSFDFEGDDDWEIDGQRDETAVYTYAQAGMYPIKLGVTDPWSGQRVEEQVEYSLSPWSESAVADDHVIGEEGRCVVFRVNPALISLEAKVDPEACDRDEDEEREWMWDFGDSVTRWGAEAGHRYIDDGIYLVTVSNIDENAPRYSSIQAHISNVAPSFLSDPVEVVSPGELYVYEIRGYDPGIEDEIILSLGEDTPEGMEILEDRQRGSWTLRWQVPEDQPEGPIRIRLKMEDGHTLTVDNEGVQLNDPRWVHDGGQTDQRYWLTVQKRGEIIGDADGGGAPSSDFGGAEATGGGEDRFAGSGFVSSGCDQSPVRSIPLWVLMVSIAIGGFSRRSKDEEEPA